jgi:hypothetical protein
MPIIYNNMNNDIEMQPLEPSTSRKKEIKHNIFIDLASISIIILIIGILIIVISLFSLQTNKLIEVLSTFTRSEMCVNMDQLVKNLNNKTLPQFNNNSI